MLFTLKPSQGIAILNEYFKMVDQKKLTKSKNLFMSVYIPQKIYCFA
jgi:hypothetical protein